MNLKFLDSLTLSLLVGDKGWKYKPKGGEIQSRFFFLLAGLWINPSSINPSIYFPKLLNSFLRSLDQLWRSFKIFFYYSYSHYRLYCLLFYWCPSALRLFLFKYLDIYDNFFNSISLFLSVFMHLIFPHIVLVLRFIWEPQKYLKKRDLNAKLLPGHYCKCKTVLN